MMSITTVDPTLLLIDFEKKCETCGENLKVKAGNKKEGDQKLDMKLTEHQRYCKL